MHTIELDAIAMISFLLNISWRRIKVYGILPWEKISALLGLLLLLAALTGPSKRKPWFCISLIDFEVKRHQCLRSYFTQQLDLQVRKGKHDFCVWSTTTYIVVCSHHRYTSRGNHDSLLRHADPISGHD